MCESCNTDSNPNWETDYLNRYLKEQQARLDSEGSNPEVRAEVEKAQKLLEKINDPERVEC